MRKTESADIGATMRNMKGTTTPLANPWFQRYLDSDDYKQMQARLQAKNQELSDFRKKLLEIASNR